MTSIIKMVKVSEVPRAVSRPSRPPAERAAARETPSERHFPAMASIAVEDALTKTPMPLSAAASPAKPAALVDADAAAERQELARRRQEAERDGYEQGIRKAKAEADKLRQEQLQRFAALLESLDAERHRLAGRMEDAVVEIAFESLARLVGRSQASAAGVVALVREVLAQHCATQPQITLRLAPADLALVGEDGLTQIRAGLRAAITFESDERVHAGGCLIETPSGSLDARLEVQIERLKLALLDARKAAELP